MVDDDLAGYLVRFQEEAQLRGIIVDYDKHPVEARLELHEENINLGWCSNNQGEPKVIFNTLFWSILSDLDKEKLVFHELGHCILKRSHLDTSTSDGRCTSIMHSGQACADDYSTATRSGYLDELFLR